MQDIFVSERGYMPKIQVSHRIRVNRSGILYIYIINLLVFLQFYQFFGISNFANLLECGVGQ
jgi:hypothetical protein